MATAGGMWASLTSCYIFKIGGPKWPMEQKMVIFWNDGPKHIKLYILTDTCMYIDYWLYSKTCLKQPLKKEDQLLLNAGQKFCRMLQGEHSAILLTFIKLLFVIKIFVLSFLSGCLRHVLLYWLPIGTTKVLSVFWSLKTCCKMNIFIKVRFFHN